MTSALRQLQSESHESIANTVSFRVLGLTPPSVNHYKEPLGKWRDPQTGVLRPKYRLTPEALAFKQAIAIFARGESIIPANPAERRRVRYGLFVRVVHGPGEFGDGDNYWKCIADGLKEAGVIHSDARVKVWFLVVKDDDRDNPRTEITATVLNESDFAGAQDVWATKSARPRCLRDLEKSEGLPR